MSLILKDALLSLSSSLPLQNVVGLRNSLQFYDIYNFRTRSLDKKVIRVTEIDTLF